MGDRGSAWTDLEWRWMADFPSGTYDDFLAAFPGTTRSRKSFINRRSEFRRNNPFGPSFDHLRANSDKKVDASGGWRAWVEPMARMQELDAASRTDQDYARIDLETEQDIAVALLSDIHIGSWSTDPRLVERTIDAVLDAGCYVALLGDALQMAIRLRSVGEVMDNQMTSRQQFAALSSLMDELGPRVLWSTHDNHSVAREEDAIGWSPYAELMGRHTIYHDGIGTIELRLYEGARFVSYRIASSHKFRGSTGRNPLAGQKAYMRLEDQDVDVAVAGDVHKPALEVYYEGGRRRVAVNCGTLQTNSIYARRHFSVNARTDMPVLLFGAREKRVTPFMDLKDFRA